MMNNYRITALGILLSRYIRNMLNLFTIRLICPFLFLAIGFSTANAEILPGYSATVPSGGALAGDTPRVIVISDITPFGESGEFDDRISMIDLMLFADVIDIEGIFADETAMTQILDAYEVDYSKLSTYGSYPTHSTLRSKVVQFNSSNLVQHMNALLSNGDTRPLYILDWRGGFSGVTEAVTQVDPTLLGKNWRYISVSIGNYGNRSSFTDLYQANTKPWWININWQYQRYLGTSAHPAPYNNFSQNFVQGNGNLGSLYFQQSFDYTAGNSPRKTAFHRAGDNVTFTYLLRGNPNSPSGEHWGGSYDNIIQPHHGSDYGNSINSNYWTTTQDPSDDESPSSPSNPWGQKMSYDGEKSVNRYHMQFFPELASRYRRLKYPRGKDPSPIDVFQYTNNSSATDNTNINEAPVPAVEISTLSADTNTTINFNGANSYDPDGSITAYRWDFGDGNFAYEQSATHSYVAAGSYKASLRVTDNNNKNSYATRTITISAPPATTTNQAPVPAVEISTLSANTNTSISFNGTNSYDPDGSITAYRWDFGDGNFAYQRSATHSYASAGSYKVSLRVTDNNNQNAYGSRTITVKAPPVSTTNQAPVAQFTTNKNSITLGEEITLNAQNSYDPDGTVNSYNWDFGDGNTGSDVTTEHIYQSAGTYRITLTITDDKNMSSTTSKTVTVVEDTQVETSQNQEEESPDVSTDELAIESGGGHMSLYALLLLLLGLGCRRTYKRNNPNS